MKVTNPHRSRAVDATRGLTSTRRAGSRGIDVRDAVVESHPTTTIEFVGAGVEDLDNGVARVTIGGTGGTPGSGGGATGSAPVDMLNNSGQDLLPGDVVVTDDTADEAVTVTNTVGSTLIAGIVAEPIADGEIGPVLFNGYAPVINDPAAVRGQYAQTSTTVGQSQGTVGRVGGSFAVYLTDASGAGALGDFVSASAVTEASTPATSATLNVPAIIPAGRVLFAALWLKSTISSPTISGWTLIGAESGFYYFIRPSLGDDTAVASWTGLSAAAAAVLLLHNSVVIPAPIEAHDYDNTTSAAALVGLADLSHYAVAGVQSLAATPGGWSELAQAGITHSDEFDDPTRLTDPWGQNAGDPTTLHLDIDSTLAGQLFLQGQLYQAAPAAPYTIIASVTTVNWDQVSGFPGIGGILINLAEAAPGPYIGFGVDVGQEGIPNHEMHLGSSLFDSTGAFVNNPHVVGIVHDASYAVPHLTKVVVNSATSVDAYVSFNGGVSWTTICTGYNPAMTINYIGLEAGGSQDGWTYFHVSPDSTISGTLVGKNIDHDATVISPFTGSTDQNDALFAFTLLRDPMASALLYGPDLSEAAGATATYAWQPLFNSGDGTAILDEGGNPIMAFAPV